MQDQAQSSQSSTGLDLSRTGSYDHAKQLASEFLSKSVPASDSENRFLLILLVNCYLLVSLRN